MKKVLASLILITAVLVHLEPSTVNAAPRPATGQPVSVEITVSSSGSGGSQFTLNGLQTPTTPDYTCNKATVVSAATGNGASVKFALIDTNSVDQTKITVNGTAVGRLTITDDSYIDQAGNANTGRIYVRTLR